MKTKLSFCDWMREVDHAVSQQIGLGIDDLPDVCLRDWYKDGVSAKSAAKKAIRSAKADF